MNAVILQGADQFQAGAIAHMSQSRIAVTAEIALQNFPVCRTVEYCAPALKFPNPVGGFLGVQFGHSPVVHVLAAAHRVGKMDFPVVTVIDVGQRGSHTAFRHHGVRLAKKRFANQSNSDACRRSFNGRTQPRAARANYEHIVFESCVIAHLVLQKR